MRFTRHKVCYHKRFTVFLSDIRCSGHPAGLKEMMGTDAELAIAQTHFYIGKPVPA